MEDLLGKIAAQSVSFAIKSGIGVVSSFAIRETTRYIRTIKGKDREELLKLQARLQTNIDIISPAIDLVELIAARGNTSLESALALTKALRYDIQSLAQRVADATSVSESKLRKGNREDIKAIMDEIRNLLHRIEDAVPLINLAVTTSGTSLSTSIPHTVSPSRLLQASIFLATGDSAYALNPSKLVQIGMSFDLTLYMLFAGHSHRRETLSTKELTWQEVISKCRVKLVRVPLVFDDDDDYHREGGEKTLSVAQAMRAKSKAEEYCYELCLIEDLDDGRVHEAEEGKEPPRPYEDVEKAGIRARIPIHQISKLFYTNSGKLLGIAEASSPVLLLKRDMNAAPPRKLLDRAKLYEYGHDFDIEGDFEDKPTEEDEVGSVRKGEEDDAYGLPKHLDPEWLAFELWSNPIEDETDEDDGEDDNTDQESRHSNSRSKELESNTAELNPGSTVISNFAHRPGGTSTPAVALPLSCVTVKSNLALLECLLRLASLQNFQQCSHLSVHDELLNLFLSDGNSWLGSKESREREREYAKQRIGFDPFESPTLSGDEETQSISGRRTDKAKRLKQKLPNTPGSSRSSRGRSMLPMIPKSASPVRSDSPGAQLRLEGNVSRGQVEGYNSHSYPSTPARSGQERKYAYNSAKLHSRNHWDSSAISTTFNDSPFTGK